jgi:hypothetical protein
VDRTQLCNDGRRIDLVAGIIACQEVQHHFDVALLAPCRPLWLASHRLRSPQRPLYQEKTNDTFIAKLTVPGRKLRPRCQPATAAAGRHPCPATRAHRSDTTPARL